MPMFLRSLACIIVGAFSVWVIQFWYQTFIVGNLYLNADSIVVTVGALVPLAAIVFGGYLCRFIMQFNHSED